MTQLMNERDFDLSEKILDDEQLIREKDHDFDIVMNNLKCVITKLAVIRRELVSLTNESAKNQLLAVKEKEAATRVLNHVLPMKMGQSSSVFVNEISPNVLVVVK